MKNILMLTTMYPSKESPLSTPVCHYFAKVWVEMGYNVHVIHYRSVFPIIFYWVRYLFRNFVTKIVGNDDGMTWPNIKDFSFTKNGVTVHSLPIFKLLPHGKYSKKTILEQLKKIAQLNKSENFVPDLIVGHTHNPQLELVSKLTCSYPNARSCVVIHETNTTIIGKTHPNEYQLYIDQIDILGFRSKAILEKFESLYGNVKNKFLCFSGIPENFIVDSPHRQFDDILRSFIFVGQLISRKFPSVIIPAIDARYIDKKYKINYIGEGIERFSIIRMAESLSATENIFLFGNIPRKQVIKLLDESDCMLMISYGETFGLVYLEAMARGCITIGSRGEGMVGIIDDGVNGFLCEAGNSDELSEIIGRINLLTPSEKKRISNNAIKTATKFSDYNVAKNYINAVIGLNNK